MTNNENAHAREGLTRKIERALEWLMILGIAAFAISLPLAMFVPALGAVAGMILVAGIVALCIGSAGMGV